MKVFLVVDDVAKNSLSKHEPPRSNNHGGCNRYKSVNKCTYIGVVQYLEYIRIKTAQINIPRNRLPCVDDMFTKGVHGFDRQIGGLDHYNQSFWSEGDFQTST